MRNGAYRIVRPLNKGGMGMIYLAEDLGAFGRMCVIKEMLDYFDPANPLEVQEAQQRFEDEARTLAKLKHPQIPDLLSYFSEGQHNYIVMEFVQGDTLEHFIAQPAAAAKVVSYGIQVCEILEYLGGLNPPVVHQDIKPANIIVDSATQSAWLVDFGIARHRPLSQQNWRAGGGKTTARGTPGYAAPEQYQPGQSEPKSDVYALAATLYHVLTGDDPQDHPFSFPMLAALPTGLTGALSAALQQDVRRRCTAAEFRLLLQKKGSTKLPPSHPPPSQHQSYAVIVTQPIADSERPGMIGFLQQELGLSALEAEVLTWQAPARYQQGIDRAQAQALGQKLQSRGAAGVSYLTSQLHSWRQQLSPHEQSTLASQGEVVILDKRFPQDKVCHCHRCGHEWKTQAGSRSTLRELCPRCSQQWYPHRIFRCAVCGHEFTHPDVMTPAEQLFAACPKCNSTAWLPKQQIGFMQRNYTLKLPPTPIGRRLAQQVQLRVSPRGALIRGRVAPKANWLASPVLQNNVLSFEIDTHALAARQVHKTSLDVISNAGVATVTVEVYVEAPPALTVTPSSLDFGALRAQDSSTRTLELRNMGEQVLNGQVACAAGWLTVDNPVFTANQYTVRCTVFGDRLPAPGVNTTILAVTSNGGALNVPVRAEGLPTTLAVTPQALDFVIPYRRRAAPQPLVIENAGAGLLTGTVRTEAPWLKIRDDTVHSNCLETLVTVDADALKPGATVVGALHIATNGGEVDVPVTVRVAARGLLGRSIGLILLSVLVSVVLAGILMGGMWWQQEQPPVPAPPPILTTDAPSISSAAPVHTPAAVQSPSPVTSPPDSSPTSLPSATATPSPATTTSLQVIDRLRTLAAQRATQTAVATAPVTPATPVAPPVVAKPMVTPPPAQCSDPRAVITSPLPGQMLRGVAPVYGTAEHAAFRYYKLEIALRQDGEAQFSFVVDNDVPVTTGLLAVIDTTRFSNGAYILQLTVVDRSGNFPAPCQVIVRIEN